MASISVDQDQFSCPVCLDLLKDPVAIPCGHSYCMVCISGHWDQEDQRGVYSCPQCRETFTLKPVLRRNNMLAEVVEKLKKTELRASPAHCYAGPGDVECDFCTGRKLKAIKSCLTCLASFCETHLKPHYEVPSWENHKLVKASTRLREKICSQHNKLIEIYCRTDQTCICYLCMLDQHKGHDSVSAVAERTEKQSQLKEMQSESQQRIQEKEKKLQELKQAVNTIKSSAQTAVEDSERIFTELICSIEKKRSEVTELIRAQEKTELSGAEELIEQLEQEIADLKRRDTELEQLSHTEDHIHFLQSLQSLCVSSGSEDSPNITISQHPSFDKVSKSLSDLKKQLEEFCEETFNRISPHAAAVQILLSEPQTREDFLQYYCPLTLDLNTAHHHLILSEENRVIQLKGIHQEAQQKIQDKERNLEQLKQTVNTLKSSAQTAVEDSERIFTELICSIEKKRSEVTELIRAQEKTELSGAEELIEQLEQEIADLKRRNPELEQLSHTEDHIHFLQSFQFLCVSSESEDSPSTHPVNLHLSFDEVKKSLSQLKKRVEEINKEEFNRITENGNHFTQVRN
ncbi:hypothetical protein SRHO_G00073900 [Serrasalmus rhombeus]